MIILLRMMIESEY